MEDAASYDDVLRSTMQELTASFAAPNAVDDALGRLTAAAVELMQRVDYADLMLIEDGEFRSLKPTSPLMVKLDIAQWELQEGPCLEAAAIDAVIRSPDVENDPRWPRFGAAAAEAGVRSVLSYQLYTYSKGTGALNLFSRSTGTFDQEEEAIGAMLATHAAALIISANREHQFKSALTSRDVIGQAKGIIMERFHINSARAFELLTRLSQDRNTPVRQVAQELVDRTTADTPPR
jgi:GAF domain-containing protein